MTAPPDSPDEPEGLSWNDDDDLDDLPELTVPLEESLPEPGAPADPALTARLGEPGGEIGIGAPAPDEAAIPMLTEVLLAPAPTPAPAVARATRALPEDNAPDLDRLALQVQARVLENLQVGTDALIEGPLDERLHAVIELSTERLVDEIRETLRQAIRDAVGRAISEELARVHREIDEREIDDLDTDNPPAA